VWHARLLFWRRGSDAAPGGYDEPVSGEFLRAGPSDGHSASAENGAQAADVSPSSAYRYFGTKEQIVLHDEFDVTFIDAVEAELASHPPLEAVRRALGQLIAEFFGRDDKLARRKVRYAYDEPALRAATLEVTDGFVPLVADVLARASKREPDDLGGPGDRLGPGLVAGNRRAQPHTTGYRTPLAEEFDQAPDVIDRGLLLD
jgi:AcrR family transcriptional regulator